MSDKREQLREAFETEVSEQLESIELALLSSTQAPDIHQLFRDFHTIKSSAAMMGFRHMEALAHLSEDLLALVREGRTSLDEPLLELLLRALDGLKMLLRQSGEDNAGESGMEQLFDALREALSQRDGDDGATGTDTESSATVHEADPVVREVQELLEEVARELPGALGLNREGGIDAEKCRGLAEQAAGPGFLAISLVLEQLASEAESIDTEKGVQLQAELMERLAHAAEVAGASESLGPLWSALRACFFSSFRHRAEQLSQALRARVAGDEQRAFGELADDVGTVRRWVQLLGYDPLVRLLGMVAQTMRELERDDLPATPELLELLCIACELSLETETEQEFPTELQAMCEQTLESLAFCVRGLDSREADEEALETVLSQLPERPEFTELLTPDAGKELVHAFHQGQEIAEIEADLDSSPEHGRFIYETLEESTRIINSRTAFREGQDSGNDHTRIRFLVAFEGSASELEALAAELDPDGERLSLHHCSTPSAAVNAGNEKGASGAPSRSDTPEAARATGDNETLRIESRRVDSFVHRVGEMVTLRNMLAQATESEVYSRHLRETSRLLENLSQRLPEESRGLRNALALLREQDAFRNVVKDASARMETGLAQLRDEALALRVVPVRSALNRLPRLVRELASEAGKKVRLHLADNEVRVDKAMVEKLHEPLTHMIRNAVDHGIETPDRRKRAGKPEEALLSVHASQQGGMLSLVIEDDGAGLDYRRIREKAAGTGRFSTEELDRLPKSALQELIFEPGFSTAAAVTDTSGRGVGMDVVRTRLQQLGGGIDVHSEAGTGTRFTLRFPISAAIQTMLMVDTVKSRIAIPERNVGEILAISRDRLESIQGQAAVVVRGMPLPVFSLERLMWPESAAPQTASEEVQLVLLDVGEHRIAVSIDRINGREELFVRDTHPELLRLPGIGGTAVDSERKVVLIVDCDALLSLAARSAISLEDFLEAS